VTATLAAPTLDQQVAAVRRFGRFYTQHLGLLDDSLLDTGHSLSEARVLWELAHADDAQQPATATWLAAQLGLDAGYLSRVLRRLREAGLVNVNRLPTDARAQRLSLSPEGRRVYAAMDSASSAQVAHWLETLSDTEQSRLLSAMATVQALLVGPHATPMITLREPRPGDMGWVVQRHGALYAREYGWNAQFEALAARVSADFIEHFDPQRERGWIAERDGENLGCVFLVQAPADEYGENVAKLRMLLVEPAARGLGLGRRLVDECERFARDQGYRKITLWTNSVLTAARAIYLKAGYRLVKQEPHHSFGHDLVGETWELDLA
jgi:DNA-binding MarR family transcriptional regulator/GNAT superfamily N-acetyltransferase